MKRKLIYELVIIGLIATTLISCGTNPTSNVKDSTETASDSQTSVINLKQEDFNRIVANENALVLDVRTEEEVGEGIIDGASIFIDYKGSDFTSNISKLDKSKTYIVYCRSGGRSSAASEYMLSQGFEHIYNLEGGIMNWTGKISKR